MKKRLGSAVLFFTATLAARSTSFVFPLAVTIPDGDLTGYQNSQMLTGLPVFLTDVNVTLNVSGGFNGDLYAYLVHNGTSAILLNRVGRSGASGVGYPDAGFGPDALGTSFTLDDQAVHDVHLYRTFPYSLNGSGQLTGQWQPDGRALDPLSPGSAFDGASRAAMLSSFNLTDPNGLWTLFIADTSPGGESVLLSWGMQITAVPEPAFPGLLLAVAGATCFRRRLRTQCCSRTWVTPSLRACFRPSWNGRLS
jgi:hypothetical protein